jgi:hypothetical protein
MQKDYLDSNLLQRKEYAIKAKNIACAHIHF